MGKGCELKRGDGGEGRKEENDAARRKDEREG